MRKKGISNKKGLHLYKFDDSYGELQNLQQSTLDRDRTWEAGALSPHFNESLFGTSTFCHCDTNQLNFDSLVKLLKELSLIASYFGFSLLISVVSGL